MKNKLLADLKKTLVAEKIASTIPVKPHIKTQVATQEHLTDEQLLAQAMKGVKPLQLEATAPIQTAKKLDDNT